MNVVQRRRLAARAVLFLVILTTVRTGAEASASPHETGAKVEPNDNRHASGALDRRTLTVALRAGVGRWRPEGDAGPSLDIEAFGEVGKALTVPAPLIRVAP